MLQSLRDNLKGAVAVFILAIFIVPLVLFGVEQLFVGSVGGTDAAEVNGQSINVRDLQREITLDKMRLQQQYDLSPGDPQLDDSALSGPALNRMIRRTALFQAGKEGGMGAPKDELWKEIMAVESFQTDGKFDYELFKLRISNFYTPATYLDAAAKDYVLRQMTSGMSQSGFVTEADLALIAGITQQKRTFYTIEIPQSVVGDVTVEDAEIEAFFQENSSNYMTPESATIEYVELSLDKLAESNTPLEQDIKATYALEVSEFDADPKYTVAHILIEDGNASTVSEVQQKLQAGEDFAELAAQYSDDLGSKDNGGELGELIVDAYPEPFVAAVEDMSVGQVSDPVETESGTHFIKLLDVNNAEPPTFEERKVALSRQLARQAAAEEFAAKMAKLDELTFGVDNLQAAADELGLEVVTSEPFSRAGGTGIAAEQQVVNATFAEDVLEQGQNSRVLELAGGKAVVVRLKEYNPATLKSFASVKDQIEKQLVSRKQSELLDERAETLEAELVAGSQPQDLAKERGYEYSFYDAVDRGNFDIDRAVLTTAFGLPRPLGDQAVVEAAKVPTGYAVIGLVEVEDGSAGDLTEQEMAGLSNQLQFQLGQNDVAAYNDAVLEKAKVEVSN